MKRPTLIPGGNVRSLGGDRWETSAVTPWIELDHAALRGRWVRIVYATGWDTEVVRPILRSETPAGAVDAMLPGPIFGRGIGLAFVPRDCERLLVSPARGAGEFGFRVESLHAVPLWRVYLEAFRKDFGRAAEAWGAFVIGASLESRQNLAWAIGGTPLVDYAAYKARRMRPFEADGLDRSGLTPCEVIRLGEAEAVPAHIPDEALVHFAHLSCELAEEACRIAGIAARRHADVVMFYGDEEAEGPQGPEPLLKPDWSPLRQAATAYIGDAVFLRAGFVRSLAGGPTREAARAAIHNLSPDEVVHIRRILAKRVAASPASGASATLDAPEVGVSVIIPTKDRVELLEPCVHGLLTRTQAARKDIILVDNGSAEARTAEFYEKLRREACVRILPQPGPFNFSKLCNAGAAVATGDVLVFLNNDISMLEADWLPYLVQLALRPDVGAVGARLLFPGGRLQHAGVAIGMGGLAGHLDLNQPGEAAGYLSRLGGPHETGAVTGACLAVERRKFEAVGGFDAAHLPVDLNDIDLCLRLAKRGWKSVLEPRSVLVHHESASRGRSTSPNVKYKKERSYFATTWVEEIRHDPYFHPALSLFSTSVELA